MLPLIEMFRPVLVLVGGVLLLRALWVATLGAMIRLGRPRGALVPVWTLAALAAGYTLTPIEMVHIPVIDLTALVDSTVRSLETMRPVPPPEPELAFDRYGTLLRFIESPPLGIWAAVAGSAALNLFVVLRLR
jgi:hypothetical protein